MDVKRVCCGLVVVAVACGGQGTARLLGAEATSALRGEPRDAAALWQLAPADLQFGVVATGAAMRHLRGQVRAFGEVATPPDTWETLSQDPRARAIAAILDEDVRDGLAIFIDRSARIVAVLPGSDGTATSKLPDTVRRDGRDHVTVGDLVLVCERDLIGYVCATDIELSQRLGRGTSLRPTTTGDVELVARTASVQITASAVVTASGFDARAQLEAPMITPILKTFEPQTVDPQGAAGFVLVGMPAAGAAPSSGPLVDVLMGRLLMKLPAGVDDVEFEISLAKVDVVDRWLQACDLNNDEAGIVSRPQRDGCRLEFAPGFPIGSGGFDLWLDGDVLRGRRDRARPSVPMELPPTELARELASGWSVAFWGRGLMLSSQDRIPQGDGGAARPSGMGLIREVGGGARVRGDRIELRLAVWTVLDHPHEVVDALTRMNHAPGSATELDQQRAELTALATKLSDERLAADVRVGPRGLTAPIGALGILAALVVPDLAERAVGQ